MTTRRLVFLVAALYGAILLHAGLFEIVGSGPGIAYRLNRFTGSVVYCGPSVCRPAKFPPPGQ